MPRRLRRLATAAAFTMLTVPLFSLFTASPASAYVSTPGMYCYDGKITAQAPSEVTPDSGTSQTIYWLPALMHWGASGWEFQEWGTWSHRGYGDFFDGAFGWQTDGSAFADYESFRVPSGYYAIVNVVYMDGAYQPYSVSTNGTGVYCQV